MAKSNQQSANKKKVISKSLKSVIIVFFFENSFQVLGDIRCEACAILGVKHVRYSCLVTCGNTLSLMRNENQNPISRIINKTHVCTLGYLFGEYMITDCLSCL